MCKPKSIIRTVATLAATVFLAMLPQSAAVAQSTLFNVPSTDVVSKKKVYRIDFSRIREGMTMGGSNLRSASWFESARP